ncbi:glycosyltransferase family 2 protein [Sphingobacterium bovisgrunnientis]|uniref:glycosyltransferase family 2 protein n=1 Tax=Sphingobacterium bovisgrunnientis TaxID=1874697 RepID=UPI001357108D|nr:glycosyltransferase [Sphingobacterium bovisgrunnientis]
MTLKSILISVIMPCYNSELYITKAIESILNQSLSNIEFIIVDDGSTDSTVNIVKSFNDPRIKFIQLKSNKGNYFARNIGIRHAIGKYIAMFDSDDISENNRLEIQYKYLEKKKHVGAIGSNYSFIDEKGNPLGNMKRECNYQDFKIKLLENNYMLQSTIMIRRKLILKYNLLYKLKYKIASDYDFVARCSRYFPIYNIPDNLIRYRFHAKQITSMKMKTQRKYAMMIRKDIFFQFQVDDFESNYEIIELLLMDKVNNQEEIQNCAKFMNQLLICNSHHKNYNSFLLKKFFFEKIAANILRIEN